MLGFTLAFPTIYMANFMAWLLSQKVSIRKSTIPVFSSHRTRNKFITVPFRVGANYFNCRQTVSFLRIQLALIVNARRELLFSSGGIKITAREERKVVLKTGRYWNLVVLIRNCACQVTQYEEVWDLWGI